MSSLIKQSSGFVDVLTMSSREIADLTNKRHDHIIRDIREMVEAVKDAPDLGDQLNQGLKEHKDARGYTSYFDLNRFAAELLVTGYDVARRARVVKRLLELEQKQLTPVVNPAQLSRMQLIQLAMEAEEEKLALEAKVEEQAPKVEALERISEAEGAVTLTNAAKILQQQPRKFNDWLHSVGWIYRRLGRNQWTAYQEHIQVGRLTHKINAYIDGETGESKISEQVMVTPKGIAKLSEMLNMPPAGSVPPATNAYLEARG